MQLAAVDISAFVAGIAVDTDAVYFADPGSCSGSATDGALMTVPLAGGSATALASDQPCPVGVAIDSDTVYWATSDAVLAIPKAGGAIATIASSGAYLIAVDDTNVYWGNTGVQFASKIGGGSATTIADVSGWARDVAVTGSSVYFVDYSDLGSVEDFSRSNGDTTTIVTDDDAPSWIVADAGGAYWEDRNYVFSATQNVALYGTESSPMAGLALDDDNVYAGDLVVGLVRMLK